MSDSRRSAAELVLLTLILLLAAAFRFNHLDWDRGYLFHPDERQVLLVASHLHWPTTPAQLFSDSSPLNPAFFAYGSFPFYLLAALSPFAGPIDLPSPWQSDSYVSLALLGRALSATFDTGTVLLIYLLGKLLYNGRVGMLAAAAYALSVLPIQLSHFYTVDTLLTFFAVLSLYGAVRYAILGTRINLLLSGLAFGLALATKVVALPLLVPILYSLAIVGLRRGMRIRSVAPSALASTSLRFLHDSWRLVQGPFSYFATVSLCVWLLIQPYSIIDLPDFLADTSRELLLARGWLDFPYTRQFLGTPPFIYQVWQSAVWGLGLPLGLFAWGGALFFLFQWSRERTWRDSLLLLWGATFFLLIGGQQVKYLRYLLPLLPVLYLLAARALLLVRGPRPGTVPLDTPIAPIRWVIAGLCLGGGLMWAISFESIYTVEHPWLQMSRWIYQHIPPGSVLTSEQWDDTLPVLMTLDGKRRELGEYTVLSTPVFDSEDSAKLATLVENLQRADYVILASSRGYGTIPRLNARYPLTSRYYQHLFDGSLGFEPVHVATSPLRLDGIAFLDTPYADGDLIPPDSHLQIADFSAPTSLAVDLGRADESVSVYDHPTAIVFQRVRSLSSTELRARLTGAP